MALYSHGIDKCCTYSATSAPLCTLEVAPDANMYDYPCSTVYDHHQQDFRRADNSRTYSCKSLFHSANNESHFHSKLYALLTRIYLQFLKINQVCMIITKDYHTEAQNPLHIGFWPFYSVIFYNLSA